MTLDVNVCFFVRCCCCLERRKGRDRPAKVGYKYKAGEHESVSLAVRISRYVLHVLRGRERVRAIGTARGDEG